MGTIGRTETVEKNKETCTVQCSDESYDEPARITRKP